MPWLGERLLEKLGSCTTSSIISMTALQASPRKLSLIGIIAQFTNYPQHQLTSVPHMCNSNMAGSSIDNVYLQSSIRRSSVRSEAVLRFVGTMIASAYGASSGTRTVASIAASTMRKSRKNTSLASLYRSFIKMVWVVMTG